MFTAVPTYSRYRTLRLLSPWMRGEDVYALQTALAAVGQDPGAADGIFGTQTHTAVKAFQKHTGITVDGLAGGQTQREVCLPLIRKASNDHSVPVSLLYGQIDHESSFRVGNYSAPRADGSYDAGVTQRNTEHTAAREGFDVPDSIDTLAAHVRASYDRYGVAADTHRRWALACGSWNAPAYANYLAGVKPWAIPSDAARRKLEAYMASVTAYYQ